MHKVIYQSKDGHQFEFLTKEEDQQKAIKKGYEKIEKLEYSHFGYSVKSIDKASKSIGDNKDSSYRIIEPKTMAA